jgi:hypothetical protein
MNTQISIHGTDFYINGNPTYQGRYHKNRRIEGLLFNSRMVQAIFDDENPHTRHLWRYPDTQLWDPDRNTNEFCQSLPIYHQYGLLAVTVGLQGGGPIYSPDIYTTYLNSTFGWDGTLKTPYLNRLYKVLRSADQIGMVVIINYFYGQQSRRFESEKAIKKATEGITAWILEKGFRNVLVDIFNEIQQGTGLLQSRRIHELIDIVKSTSQNGNRLLVGTSIHPFNPYPPGQWSQIVDMFIPHGNNSPGNKLREEIRAIKQSTLYQQKPKPILINEDSIDTPNLDIAVDEGASWGFYSQGFGSHYRDFRWDWTFHDREKQIEKLSGYQTPPINWGINTDFKKMFFNRVKTITGI